MQQRHQQLKFNIGTVLNSSSNVQAVVDFGNQVPMTETKMKSVAQGLVDFLKEKENFNSKYGFKNLNEK